MSVSAKPQVRRAGRYLPSEAPKKAGGWSLEWTYFAFIMVVWCFSPLLRRVIDWRHGGFNPTSPISLLPFVVILPLALVCFRRERLARMTPAFKACLTVWLAVFTYGFLVAAFFENTSAGAYSLVQYLVPVIPGIWLAGQGLSSATCLRRLVAVAVPIGAVVAVYGIFQYVAPAAWDVLWIQGSEFTSAGLPVPFGLRIFSTLNSPGPAADFFELIFLFALQNLRLKSVWAPAFTIVVGAALLLTLVREAWVGLVIGCGIYLVISPLRARVVPMFSASAVLFVFLIVSLPAVLGSGPSSDVISARLSTLGDTDSDESAITRRHEIEDALALGLAHPLGSGLGTTGAAARLGSNPESILGNNLDSGYLSRLVELGIPGFLGYAFVLLSGTILAIRGASAAYGGTLDERTSAAVAATVSGALLWSDAAGDAHYGLNGLLFWLALGIGSLAFKSVPVPSRKQTVVGVRRALVRARS